MRSRNAAIIATAGMLLFLGAGCLRSDVSLVLEFVTSWLASRGIVDQNGNPTAKTGIYVASGGWISTGDKGNDAIIDGGRAVKNIKDADQSVRNAHAKAEEGDYAAANASLDATLEKRPNDHHVRNAKGAVLLQQGRTQEAKAYLSSTSKCDTQSGAVGKADYERCKRMLRDENDQLRRYSPHPDDKVVAKDGPQCANIRQRKAALVRLEDIALLQSDSAAAAQYNKEYNALHNYWPTCQ